jgi:hypothetical protein
MYKEGVDIKYNSEDLFGSNDQASEIFISSEGNVWIAANYVNTIAKIVRGEVTSSISEIVDYSDVSIYPNPAEGAAFLIFRDNNSTLLGIELFNLEGRLVKKIELKVQSTVQKISIDIKDLNPGFYSLTMIKKDKEWGEITRQALKLVIK